MRGLKALLPIVLAAAVVGTAWLAVRYLVVYETPGMHWAPASPIAGELARFQIDLGQPGIYAVSVAKLASKFPLLFVEYKSPGPLLDTRLELPDGKLRLKMRFADEGQYRIEVRNAAGGADASLVFEQRFTVRTPLTKYAVDGVFVALLLAAGYFSGRQLRQLAAPAAVVLLLVLGARVTPSYAHDMELAHVTEAAGNDQGLALRLMNRDHPGMANTMPLLWDLQVQQAHVALTHVAFDLEVIHAESGQPTLALAGVMPGDRLMLRYAPPDGADYQIEARVTAATGGVALPMYVSARVSAEAKSPSATRHLLSFAVLMFPALLGMAWGYWKTSVQPPARLT